MRYYIVYYSDKFYLDKFYLAEKECINTRVHSDKYTIGWGSSDFGLKNKRHRELTKEEFDLHMTILRPT